MSEYIEAWQCIGCGKIEAPQPCIGVCRDRKILMVGKDEHQRVLDAMRELRQQLLAAQAVLSQLAWSTPRDGQWESSWRALQLRARALPASATPGSPVGAHPVRD